MKIGIDVSQVVYEGTGVGRYVRELIPLVIKLSPQNEFILFGSSLRQREKLLAFMSRMKERFPNVRTVVIPLPLSMLDFLWNTLHIIPISVFTGTLDVFWSSDWIQPPLGNTKGITTIHDVSFLHYPESFHKTIISVQKRRIARAIKECAFFLCDSKATRSDVLRYYPIPADDCAVVYPGYHAE